MNEEISQPSFGSWRIRTATIQSKQPDNTGVRPVVG